MPGDDSARSSGIRPEQVKGPVRRNWSQGEMPARKAMHGNPLARVRVCRDGAGCSHAALCRSAEMSFRVDYARQRQDLPGTARTAIREEQRALGRGRHCTGLNGHGEQHDDRRLAPHRVRGIRSVRPCRRRARTDRSAHATVWFVPWRLYTQPLCPTGPSQGLTERIRAITAPPNRR